MDGAGVGYWKLLHAAEHAYIPNLRPWLPGTLVKAPVTHEAGEEALNPKVKGRAQ